MKIVLMISIILLAALLAGQAMAQAAEEKQVIDRAAGRSKVKAPAQFFTGEVELEMLLSPKGSDAPFGAAYVTFSPGARSHWHTHPTGQHLIVTSGLGLTGTWDGQIEEIREGDVLWCPPGVKHWHGAAPGSGMTHMALTGSTPEGHNVDWMEPVTDEQYNPVR